MTDSPGFGRSLWLERERRGLTQAGLANLLGVSQQAVSRWEAGGSLPGPAQLASVAGALGIDMSDTPHSSPAPPAVASRSLLRALPLATLSPTGFEAFCADLVHLCFGATAQRWGRQGDAQSGVDIVTKMADGRVLAFQCKRHRRFGPDKVSQAVSAVTLDADRHYLLLSRTASTGARAAIATVPGWELWDDDDLSRIVRFDLDRDSALRLVDSHFPGLREAFFDIADPGPWLTTEEYFRPFRARERALSHDWDLIGRRREVGEVTSRLERHRVALVVGAGGSGKSRFLKAVAEASEQGPVGLRVRFLADNVALERRHFERLGREPCLVIVDDAHERNDLPMLFQELGRLASGVEMQLLLAARPSAEVRVRGELDPSGLVGYEQADEITLRLPSLTIDETASLSRQVLRFLGGSLAYADAIAASTADCPLATVVGSRLMAAGVAHTRLLGSESGFREMLLTAFRDELLGGIGRPGDERNLRELLDLVALVQPVEADDPHFTQLAEKLLAQSGDRIVRLLGSLETGGVLRRRGRTLRVVPDVLADHVVLEACLAHGGVVRTGFADRAFSHATSPYQLNLVRNLARLDWQIPAATGPGLLTDVWDAIRREFRSSGVTGRWELLRSLSDISWFQPKHAIELARIAMEESTDRDDDAWRRPFGSEAGSDPVLEAVPAFLRGAAHHIDYLPEVFELLWALGRKDERQSHAQSDHPLRVLQDVASLRVGVPLTLVDSAIDVARGWLMDSNLERYAHSPFDVLDKVLETEILSQRWHRHNLEIRALPIPWRAVRPLRAKVVDAAFDMLTHGPLQVRMRALETIGCAVRPLRTSFERLPHEEELAGWTSQAIEVVARLSETIAAHELDALLLERIELMVWRGAEDHSELGSAKHALLACLPETPDRELTRAIEHDRAPYNFIAGRFAEAAPEWLKFQKRVAEDLCRRESPVDVVNVLADRVAVVKEPSRQFFDALFRGAPGVARLIVERRLSCDRKDFDRVLDLAVARWRVGDLRLTREWLNQAVDCDDPVLLNAVVRAMTNDRPGVLPPTSEEIRIVRDLGAHVDEGVRVGVAQLARRVATSGPAFALDLLSGVTIQGSSHVARSIAWQYAPVGPLRVEDLNESQRLLLVEGLEATKALEDDWIGGLLGSLSRTAPLDVVGLLQRRVATWRTEPTLNHQPVPFHWADSHSPLRVRESLQFEEALRSIREWGLLHLEDSHYRFWAPHLWAAVSGDNDERVLECLCEWLPSPDPRELMAVSMLLSGTPRLFVWDRVDVVVALLNQAETHGRECLRGVRRDLWSCASSGVRERTPGEPSIDEVKQRDQGAAVAAELTLGSPGRLFYRDLSLAAQASIEALAIMDEEWEDEQ